MLKIFEIIAPLFIIIFASAILRRVKIIGENWESVLNSFALKIGLPVLIFSVLSKVSFSFADQGGLLISNSIFLLINFLIAFLLGKFLFSRDLARTIFLCLPFKNVAYLGIPILTQVAGASILPVASLIIAVYTFWTFTLGVGFSDYTEQKNKKDVLKKTAFNLVKNPVLVATFLGIIAAIFKIPIPEILKQSMDMVTAAVTPTVLIVIGLFIGKSKFGHIADWVPILMFSLITLLVLPGIFFVGAKLFGASLTQFSPSMIDAAMPMAITPFALADKYNLDKNFIARSIVLSTILSIISIPFWTSLL